MTPILVTAPTGSVVWLHSVKDHLRVTNDEDGALIAAMTQAAVAHLDGWTGVLGRCIGAQEWRVSVSAGGVVLPMPDVTLATAAYQAGPAVLAITATALGPRVEVTEACDVTFVCEMRPGLLPVAQMAVKLLVGHWYENRSAVGESGHEMPLALGAIIDAIRWRRI
jgi:hypothetical protein